MIIGRLVPHMLLVALIATGFYTTADDEAQTDERQSPSLELPLPAGFISSTPQQKRMLPLDKKVKWENLVVTDEIVIDVDPTSMTPKATHNGWEVLAKMRIGFFQEIPIKGSTRKGWYYVNDMVAMCKEDAIRIDKSTVYDVDGKEIVSGKNLGVLQNPKNAKSFITIWLHVTCNQLRNTRVPIMT